MENSCAPPPSADAPALIADARGLDHARTGPPGASARPGDARSTLAPTRHRAARSARRSRGRLTLDGGAEQVCGKLATLADSGGAEVASWPLGPDPVREPTAFVAAAAPS
ncbi:hypothetical protein [Embleya scabrispora]|uniref:hypothetical protein n=1 Tax=Embleya scabrispora TaxID=159449 RepID=UPI000362C3A3|nr:hypothetical protein [Embleya scabrispora]MYS81849.1 hypothetical protein [Streptomyces sp. SID5474]